MTPSLYLTNVPIRWRNGSREKPHALLDIKTFKCFEDILPTFQTAYAGTVILEGPGSYAYYDGHYYFLSPIKVHDQGQEHFVYSMLRDLGADALMNHVMVTGTLRKTTNETVLEEYFHLTKPLIDTASTVEYVRLEQQAENQINILSFEPMDLHHTITTGQIPVLLQNPANDLKTKILQAERENRIRTYIPPLMPSYKYSVYDKLLETLQLIKENQYSLSQVTIAGSPLNGLGTITRTSHPLGTHHEMTAAGEIGLSNMTDIRPVDSMTLQDIDPNKNYQDISLDEIRRDYAYKYKNEEIENFLKNLYSTNPNHQSLTDLGPEKYRPDPKTTDGESFQLKRPTDQAYPFSNTLFINYQKNRIGFGQGYSDLIQVNSYADLPPREALIQQLKSNSVIKQLLSKINNDLLSYNNYGKYGNYYRYSKDPKGGGFASIDPSVEDNGIKTFPVKDGDYDYDFIAEIIENGDEYIATAKKYSS